MPLPGWLARFNRSVTNHVTRPLIRHFPGGAVVVHTGRRSGRQYRTPVLAFARDGGYDIALTYGPDVDWVRNVMAAGGCRLEVTGGVVELTNPILLEGDDALGSMSSGVRRILRAIDVDRAVRLDDADQP